MNANALIHVLTIAALAVFCVVWGSVHNDSTLQGIGLGLLGYGGGSVLPSPFAAMGTAPNNPIASDAKP